jgi:hypothetical protein
LEELHSHLAYYTRTGKIDVWDDTKFPRSAKRSEEIEQALSTARVAVLLISADFLASDSLANNELISLLAAAAYKGTTIYSVILRSCVFDDTELAQFHPINDAANPLSTMSKGKRDAVWTKIAELIR